MIKSTMQGGLFMDIGLRIRNRREELNMTQEELARKLGYANRSSVNKVENSREVSMKKIKAYADALDTTVPYLMGWETIEPIVVMADLDGSLLKMDNRVKLYALKLAELSEEDRNDIMKMIDRFGK
jgi:transcriptional regulator with XRE-family HTH domain